MWLSRDVSFEQAKASIEGSNAAVKLTGCYKVSSFVNSIKNDGEDCILELQKYNQKAFSKGIGKYFQVKRMDHKTPNPIGIHSV
jgi:hypothetical protein